MQLIPNKIKGTEKKKRWNRPKNVITFQIKPSHIITYIKCKCLSNSVNSLDKMQDSTKPCL